MNSSTIEIIERSVNDLRPPERSLRLALNRVAEDAGWDKENLREELKYLLEMVKKQHRPGRVATDRAS